MDGQVDKLCQRLSSLAEKHEGEPQAGSIKECVEFLRWLDNHHFVFLGYREYDLKESEGTKTLQIHPDSSLGVLRDVSGSQFESPVPFDKLSANLKERVTGGPPVWGTRGATLLASFVIFLALIATMIVGTAPNLNTRIVGVGELMRHPPTVDPVFRHDRS